MTQLYVQLLNIAAGALLLTAVLILWRRELSAIIHVLRTAGHRAGRCSSA